jgi:hypothetical protein
MYGEAYYLVTPACLLGNVAAIVSTRETEWINFKESINQNIIYFSQSAINSIFYE